MKNLRNSLVYLIILIFAVAVSSCKNEEDTSMPYIILGGDNPYYVNGIGGQFVEQGYTAYDDVDGDLSNKVIVTYPIILTDSAKSYEAVYSVSDFSGNEFTTRRSIVVRNASYVLDGFYGTCRQLCDTTADTLYASSVYSSEIANGIIFIKNFGNLGTNIDVEASLDTTTKKISFNTGLLLPDSSTLDSYVADSCFYTATKDSLKFQIFYTHSKNGGPPQFCRSFYNKQ